MLPNSYTDRCSAQHGALNIQHGGGRLDRCELVALLIYSSSLNLKGIQRKSLNLVLWIVYNKFCGTRCKGFMHLFEPHRLSLQTFWTITSAFCVATYTSAMAPKRKEDAVGTVGQKGGHFLLTFLPYLVFFNCIFIN